MHIIYKPGTKQIKAAFVTSEEAREYHRRYGGDFACEERCACQHRADQHISGDGPCYLCDCMGLHTEN